jgi:type I restriction enzyme R subunit
MPLMSEADTTNLLNTALEDIFFQFVKVSEEELMCCMTNSKTREALLNNFGGGMLPLSV